jgi:hypothetical protein
MKSMFFALVFTFVHIFLRKNSYPISTLLYLYYTLYIPSFPLEVDIIILPHFMEEKTKARQSI